MPSSAIIPVVVVLAAGTLFVLMQVYKRVRADEDRAANEHRLRKYLRRLVVAAILGVGCLVVATVTGRLGHLPAPPRAEAATAASPKSPCASSNTGTLTLTRTTPTHVTWTYTPRGGATGGAAQLYLIVDHHDAGTTTSTLGDLTVAATPVEITVEGMGPGGRVHAKCRI